MPDKPDPPVAELFDRVRGYAAQLSEKGLSVKKPLKQGAPIVLFCQLFFQQFFAYAFDFTITSVDQDAKLRAIALRDERHPAAATADVVRSFEDLCDMWPDILGATYGGLGAEFKRFHTDYVPLLLRRIDAWAAAEAPSDARLAPVERAAREADKVWRAAVKNL